ncbi:tyrosine-type recombinase/integrase [Paenibacillus alvei]|uniref:Tyrosine-type recombinase/integrase n=1 Tax=Paenibacillus alvei TaxID=44250 RepID=A0ABT4GUH5_PAEAL|nr:tyrosine-type recombinase/integrase [Paenibacillus alvei]MCY9760358.1 tyrosine-type recombinase/integrase [Paenibacillus alvei]MCY9767650.1 tyrosine-type recombinase/integrase [Paenibacillus alvei]
MSGNQRSRRRNVISATEQNGTELSGASTDFDIAVEEFIRDCNVKNLTVESIKFYRDCLKYIVNFLRSEGVDRPIDVEKRHIEDAILKKKEGVKMVTVDKNLRGWKAFFNFLHHEGLIRENPCSTIKPLKYEKHIVETFTKEQINKLLSAPNRATFTGYRDYVIMLFLIDTGVRISELCGVKTTDIDWKNNVIRIFGKGRKERFVPFGSTLYRHLKEYLSIRGILDQDFVWVNIDNNPLQQRSIQDYIREYGMMAGISGVRVSPHTFRHTFAKMYVMNGGDAFSLQKILGHTSLEIVRMYVNMFGTDVMKQHRKFSPLERLNDE